MTLDDVEPVQEIMSTNVPKTKQKLCVRGFNFPHLQRKQCSSCWKLSISPATFSSGPMCIILQTEDYLCETMQCQTYLFQEGIYLVFPQQFSHRDKKCSFKGFIYQIQSQASSEEDNLTVCMKSYKEKETDRMMIFLCHERFNRKWNAQIILFSFFSVF